MKKFIVLAVIGLLGVTNVASALSPIEPGNVALDIIPTQFTTDLSLGNTGTPVTLLQIWLINHGFLVMPAGAVKGTFGPATKAAVIKYQLSQGLPGTGFVGALTRAKLNGSNTKIGNQAPIINGIDAPTKLKVGEVGTWKVRASDPENGPLGYTVDWGDNIRHCIETPGVPSFCGDDFVLRASDLPQNSTFTHSYATAGTYTVQFSVTDDDFSSNSSSITVQVGDVGANFLTVLTPNGGEQWEINSNETITWQLANQGPNSKVDLYLDGNTCNSTPNAVCPAIYFQPILLDKNISGNSYEWIVGTDIVNNPIPARDYKLKICLAGTNACDMSDQTFTLTSPAPIKLISPNGGEELKAGKTFTIRWESNVRTDNNKVHLYAETYNAPCPQCGMFAPSVVVLDKDVPNTGSYKWKVPTRDYGPFKLVLTGTVSDSDNSADIHADASDAPFTIVR